MPQNTLILSFPDATPAEAERLAKQVETMLREEVPGIELTAARSDPDSQSGPDLLLLSANVAMQAAETLTEHTRVIAGVAIGTAVFEGLRELVHYLRIKLQAKNPVTGETQVLQPAGGASPQKPKS